MGDGATAKDPSDELERSGEELAGRVERGELSRDALELLAAVDHAPSRRALSKLELVLTRASVPARLDELPPTYDDTWLRWGGRFEVFDRAVAVETALAIARAVLPALEEGEEAPSPSHLVGLHTGPAGAIVLTEDAAFRIFPLASAAGRVLDAAARWVEDPAEPSAERVDAAWPELLRERRKVTFLCDLVDVPWEAAWTWRWVVAAVCGPEREVGAAVGHVATWAHEALGERAAVRGAAREVLRARLLEPRRAS